ncbi:hypothetical protein K470DRAFT_256073 [Piedraia hortae CBS 480.64]|uniref:Uncharacterized protein n=1 Tax=Piedraia hortae CBS 480.64 TaxID=1314780 RepID=A0A6A7C4K6_9PEZI|nr:hypothetical protein K470DRAFT_256073 [Piedraia hortae CBS 480.64]
MDESELIVSPPASSQGSPKSSKFPETRIMVSSGANKGDLQAIVNKQAAALQALHDTLEKQRKAFAEERLALQMQITHLKQLFGLDNGSVGSNNVPSFSFVKDSPALLTNGEAENPRRSSEDGGTIPLHRRRNLVVPPMKRKTSRDDNGFVTERHNDHLAVLEQPSPLLLSPLPPGNRIYAGHTPPVPLTPSIQVDTQDCERDTPTRNNTDINHKLTQFTKEDEDKGLSGPLTLENKPSRSGPGHIRFDDLVRRMEEIAQESQRPSVFANPSPGLASPVEEPEQIDQPSPIKSHNKEEHLASNAAIDSPRNAVELSESDTSPLARTLSKQKEIDIAKHHAHLKECGIIPKKDLSLNFGAPLGHLHS